MNATLDTAATRYVRLAPAGIGTAHAKAILFGEHAVVYGAPALAVPVRELTTVVRAARNRGTSIESSLYTGPAAAAPARLGPVTIAIEATLAHLRETGRADARGADVHITSHIPPDRGLGSSAAVAAAVAEAIARAFDRELGPQARFEIVQRAERHAHGTPSGLDARTVLASAPIHFQDGQVRPLGVGTDLALVLADSGIPGSTATAVAGVRTMRETDLGTAARAITGLGELAEAGERALRAGDAGAVGAAMTAAHDHLRRLGVSIPELNNLVGAAERLGALGAKLTGGGLGGCVLALAPTPAAAPDLAAGLLRSGARAVWQVAVNSTK